MQSTLSTPRYSPRHAERSSVDFLVLWLAVIVLVGVAVVGGWQFWHADRIFTGVRVEGVPVGGMTRAKALGHLSQELTPYPLAPISIQHENRQWVLSNANLAPQVDLLGAINRAYLVGRRGDVVAQLWLQGQALLGQQNITPSIQFNEGAIRQQISQIGAEVRRPGRAAVQVGTVSLPSQPGIDINMESSTRLVLNALLRREAASIPLQTVAVQPPDAAQTTGTAEVALTRTPITLRDSNSGLTLALDGASLGGIVTGGNGDQVNEDALRALVQSWAAQVDIQAQNARLRFNGASGAVEVLTPSVMGRWLNVEATLINLKEAIATNSAEAPLVIESVAPQVDSNRIGELGIRELIASGSSYYQGSSLARIRNIEVAAEKFVGVVIPPGGIFSFNKIVQAVSAANGFEDSLIIWGDQTMVGVGGGVCQVSTTVFRAALNAGFPIVERYNHGYVVSWYGEPGMDATIYTPSVDFRFRNDTAAHVLVQPVVNSSGGVITFNFYGTKPNREVRMSAPVITDVKEPGDVVYKVDESLAPGERKQVEYAQRGMTVTVDRTIVENGQSRVDKIVSKYQPWNAVILVSSGTEIPATPTPAAEAVTTP